MTRTFTSPRRLARVTLACWLLAAGTAGTLRAGAEQAESSGATAEAGAFFQRVSAVWRLRDRAAWLELWDGLDPQQRLLEEELARTAFASDQTTLELLRSVRPAADGRGVSADVQVFTAREPHASMAHWRLLAEKREGRWALVGRFQESQLEGLAHLSLARRAYRARNVSLRLTDFELRMEDGTLFTSPDSLGPTVLVFVGSGRVRISPQPRAEREQLRQFSGSLAVDRAVRWAFVRVHPADWERLVDGSRLEPDPHSALREAEAQRIFRARSGRSFVVDAALPASPWWLLPNVGDAVVDFPWRRGRVLTYALSRGEAEDVNLFDRDRRLQICVYPSAGRGSGRGGGGRRGVDLLEQELGVRFEPERFELSAVHTMTLAPPVPATLRLRLDDDLRVSSVATAEGTSLLHFRVREQGSIVVSLGGRAGSDRPVTVVTRYSGRHDPAAIDHELLQLTPATSGRLSAESRFEDAIVDSPPLVYSNRTAWYPRPAEEDFAPASLVFDTPEGWLGVTGGQLVSIRTEAKRTRAQYRLAQPGKFVTAVVGRLTELGLRQEGAQSVRAFATPRASGGAAAQMQLAERVLAFYAKLFGPCPYPALNLVLTEAATPGGHSPPGLVYLQRRPALLPAHELAADPANFSDLPDFFLAHELAHQWWGQASAPAGYRERWLSEAWAQYAAALWIRERHGEGAFGSMMDRMARWALRHDRMGPIHLGQRLGALQGDQRVFRAVVYDKGAWVLHMLRGLMGDEAFFAGARGFLETHRFARVGSEDLRQALERSSGRDLGAYFEAWIYDTGLPSVEWTGRSEAVANGFRTTVEAWARGAPGPLPLDISITTSGGRQPHRVTLDPGGSSWTFETSERPRRLSVNEERTLLATVERVRRRPARPQR